MSAQGLFVGNQVFSLLDGLNVYQIIAMALVVAGAIAGIAYGIYKLANPGDTVDNNSSQTGNTGNQNQSSALGYFDYVSKITSCLFTKNGSLIDEIVLNQPFIDYVRATYGQENILNLAEGVAGLQFTRDRFSIDEIRDLAHKMVELNPPPEGAVVYAQNTLPVGQDNQPPDAYEYLHIHYIQAADKQLVQDTMQFGPTEELQWRNPARYRILLNSADMPVLKKKLQDQESLSCFSGP